MQRTQISCHPGTIMCFAIAAILVLAAYPFGVYMASTYKVSGVSAWDHAFVMLFIAAVCAVIGLANGSVKIAYRSSRSGHHVVVNSEKEVNLSTWIRANMSELNPIVRKRWYGLMFRLSLVVALIGMPISALSGNERSLLVYCFLFALGFIAWALRKPFVARKKR